MIGFDLIVLTLRGKMIGFDLIVFQLGWNHQLKTGLDISASWGGLSTKKQEAYGGPIYDFGICQPWFVDWRFWRWYLSTFNHFSSTEDLFFVFLQFVACYMKLIDVLKLSAKVVDGRNPVPVELGRLSPLIEGFLVDPNWWSLLNHQQFQHVYY